MARRRIRSLPVLESGQLVGLLSDRDIIAYRARIKAEEDWWLAPVSAAMQMEPPTAAPDDDVGTASDRLGELSDGMLPVVERGLLLGFVTAIDVLEAERRSSKTPEAAAVSAADVMTEFPMAIAPDRSLIEAAGLMVENEIRHLLVVENGVLVGMLSDRDIRDLAGDPVRFAETRDADAVPLSVRDAMTKIPETVTADVSLAEVAVKLADEKIGALAVVDAEGKPLGIVSYVDVLRALAA